MSQRVDCEAHGPGDPTHVCRHLREGVACGFHPVEGGDLPTAWCDLCATSAPDERRYERVCPQCFDEARTRNETIPIPIPPGTTALGDEGFRALLDHASARTRDRQVEAQRRFDLGGYERWGADYDAALFTLGSGPHTGIVAELQIVGTFSKQSDSWLWSWGNEAFGERLVHRIARLRAFGEVRGIPRLSERYHDAVEEVDGWELTSLARYLLAGDAVYRAPMDHRLVFMVLFNLRRTS